MKLKDLYEGYELKKNDDVRAYNYNLYTTDKYDIIVLDDYSFIDLTDKNVKSEWTINNKNINNSDKIIQFIHDNYNHLYNLAVAKGTYKNTSDIHNSLELVTNIKKYNGFSDWKILDKDFIINDRDAMFGDGFNLTLVRTNAIYTSGNNVEVSLDTLSLSRSNNRQPFGLGGITHETYPYIIISGYYRTKEKT